MANDDQMFLLYFIMGTYFGPDVKGERPPKSVLQRIAEGLPPYTFEQLAGSQITTAEVQQVYYYVLRKADQSAIVQLPLLHQFLHGNLFIQGQEDTPNYPQFPDLFPPLLHYNSQSRTRFNFFENIVFIRNPEISYIKPGDLERFKRLTGLKDLFLDRDSERLHANTDGCVSYDTTVHEQKSNGGSPSIRSSRSSTITKHVDDLLEYKDPLKQVHVVAPTSSVEYNGTPVMYSYMAPLPTGNGSDDMQKVDPAMIFLPSPPTEKEWSNIVAATKHGFALTGSAATGQLGPTIGLIDIGESEDSYLFRVSLPGVRRDEREFSCEVENEGQVLIRGVTITGTTMFNSHASAKHDMSLASYPQVKPPAQHEWGGKLLKGLAKSSGKKLALCIPEHNPTPCMLGQHHKPHITIAFVPIILQSEPALYLWRAVRHYHICLQKLITLFQTKHSSIQRPLLLCFP